MCCNAATGFCCSTGTTCCLGLDCCNAAEECCGNGACCEQPCEGCQDNGTLSGGSILAAPNPACMGDTITFTVSGVVDEGGIKRVDCTAKMEIPPVEPTYTWTITKPDGTPLNGSGPVATVVPDQPGTYSCTFTATAARECPPDPITIGPSTVEVIEVDLDVDSDNNNRTGPARVCRPCHRAQRAESQAHPSFVFVSTVMNSARISR